MKETGIIFDCDGTLVNSLSHALVSFNAALERAGEVPVSPEVIKSYFGSSADKIFLNVLGDARKSELAFLHYLDHQTEMARSTLLHPGVRELLDSLQKAEVPMGIVTGRHERDLAVLLEPHGLASYFSVVVCDNQLSKPKPAPEGLLLAAGRMGLRPAETLYVGDSVMDLKAAREAGCIPVAALWDGMVKRRDMEAERPALLAETPQDVWTFYEALVAKV